MKLTNRTRVHHLRGISLLAALCLCGSSAGAQGGGVSHVDTVQAPSLRGNLLGDSAWRAATVYLPPSYGKQTRRRYPVVYLLHGFAADHRVFIRGNYQNLNIRLSMDSLIRAGAVREMIVVTPNARNAFDGSFYTNSAATGNWEDFIVRDLVAHMDRKYRTVRSRTGRGIAGHSMGGFGALRVGMRHPQTFSAVYALSPYGLGEARPESSRAPVWRTAVALTDRAQYASAGFNANLLYGLAAIYSPNPQRPPFFVDFPYRLESDTLALIPEVAARWKNTFLAMVPSHATALKRLKIAFDAGTADGLLDIPPNVAALDSMLTAMGVPHTAELYDGDHGNQIRARIASKVMPFFSDALR